MVKNYVFMASLSLLLGAAPLDAAAQQGPGRPSFPCARSSGVAERVICGDAELARLDRIMAELVAETLSLLLNAEQRAEANRMQRVWLLRRNRCSDVQCLRQHYFRRIQELARDLPSDS